MLAQDKKRDTLINMRVHSSTRDFIDQAASSIGKGRSDFMLEAACEKAQEILMDRTEFKLNDAQWQAFNNLLDNPPKPNEKLLTLLASGSLSNKIDPGKIKRNMPDPIPVMVLGRLAVDQQYQGKRLGDALLRDVILRILQAADIAGIKAILVHTISEEAKKFYLDGSFTVSPSEPMTLVLALESISGK